MTDRGDDELLDRLRRVNPVADVSVAARATNPSHTPIELVSRHRWRWRRRARVETTDVGQAEALEGLLRAANPYPTSSVDATPVTAGALFWSIVAAPTRRRRRLRSPRGLAVVLVAAGSLVASAFGYVFAERNVTNAISVRCYKSASLDTDYVGITPGASGPIGSCRTKVWAEGGFGSPRTPLLVGCVLADGAEAVFPGNSDATCTRLGLSAALAPTVTATRLAKLRKLLVTELDPDDRCVAPERARRIVIGDLAKTDFRSWTVRIAPGTSSARPCSQAYVLTTGEVIVLDPFPRLVHHEPVQPSGPGAPGPRAPGS